MSIAEMISIGFNVIAIAIACYVLRGSFHGIYPGDLDRMFVHSAPNYSTADITATVFPLWYLAACYGAAWIISFVIIRRVGVAAAPNVVIMHPFKFLGGCGMAAFVISVLAVSPFLGYLLYR